MYAPAVKILIEISPEHYDHFVAKCDGESREYAILKNGVVTRDPNNDETRVIEILCDKEEAMKLRDAASRLCPEAAPVIKDALDLAREV